MRTDKERGAVVVEGLLSLSIFMFAIFTILSIVNVCYIQAKMNMALSSAAKEISQYSFFYYKFGLDAPDKKLYEGTEDSRTLADNTIEGVSTLMDSLTKASNSAQSGDFENMIGQIQGSIDNVDSLVNQYADRIADDPTGFILGMGKMAINEMKESAKSLLCQALAKAFMKKNLKASPSDDPADFLLRYNVVDGMDGLDFQYTTFLQNGTSNLIQLVVTYDVRVIQLLNIEFDFTFRNCVKCTAWGRGISKINPEASMETKSPPSTIWDTGPVARGKYIVDKERENYEYPATGNGYDAYDSDTNTFISIITVDTTTESGAKDKYVTDRLDETLKKMKEGADKQTDGIEVTGPDGKPTTVPEGDGERSYKLVLVVPDGADKAALEKLIRDFEKNNPGVTVELKDGYGDPTPKAPPVEAPKEDGQ